MNIRGILLRNALLMVGVVALLYVLSLFWSVIEFDGFLIAVLGALFVTFVVMDVLGHRSQVAVRRGDEDERV
ncbi:MAG: hypothetical protein GX344_13855 [Intrasporangiaceae bacterium]|nr:hypothetical protein [Intrasporangiaceae bacterium]